MLSPNYPSPKEQDKPGGVSNSPDTKRKTHVLIVEDEVELANMIAQKLASTGMKTDVCFSAEEVLTFFDNKSADLILMDICLPNQDGFQLIKQLRRDLISIPVIFLTAINADAQKIRGLDLGGDDYIVKPFNFPELIARIHAVLRRTEFAQVNRLVGDLAFPKGSFPFCGSTVDPERQEIIFPDGVTEKIGQKEVGILCCLYKSRGSVLRRRLLLRKVWGTSANFRSRSLDQYIVKIRDRLQLHACAVDAFTTVHGIGYLYDPEGIADKAAVLAEKKE